MIYVHSLGRASRYYSAQTALAPGGSGVSFSELETRVKGVAAALSAHGFSAGDRLAILLPNGPEYIELVYACTWLGVIAVPLNTTSGGRSFPISKGSWTPSYPRAAPARY
jgi:acyl-CoA synthetase (AMP-forming)/AMP-acid ligase II